MSIAIDEDIKIKEKLQTPKKYNIWALDNDHTAFNEVVYILVKSFNMSEGVASELTTKIDREGKAKVNPRPMSKGLAQAQLDKINNIKRYFAEAFLLGTRKKEIMMLKFIIKED